MPAALTDKFTKVGAEGAATTLAGSGKAVGATSLVITSASGWPTDTAVVFAIRVVDSTGTEVPGTYTEWLGTLSGTTLTMGSSPVPLAGSDQQYSAGSLTQVYIPLSSARENAIMAAILQQHNQDGSHKGITTDTLATSGNASVGGTLSATNPKFTTALLDSNGNVLLAINPVTSAVNNLQASNAATGGAPILQAVGADTNISLVLKGKGTGFVLPQVPFYSTALSGTSSGNVEAVMGTLNIPAFPVAVRVLLMGVNGANLGSGAPTNEWENFIRKGSTTGGSALASGENNKTAATSISEARTTTLVTSDTIAANTAQSYVWTVLASASASASGQFQAWVFAQ